jgi:hypothetical protein
MKALAKVLTFVALTCLSGAYTQIRKICGEKMKAPTDSIRKPASGRGAIALLLALAILCLLGPGCFVIRGERRIKPNAPGSTKPRIPTALWFIIGISMRRTSVSTLAL